MTTLNAKLDQLVADLERAAATLERDRRQSQAIGFGVGSIVTGVGIALFGNPLVSILAGITTAVLLFLYAEWQHNREANR